MPEPCSSMNTWHLVSYLYSSLLQAQVALPTFHLEVWTFQTEQVFFMKLIRRRCPILLLFQRCKASHISPIPHAPDLVGVVACIRGALEEEPPSRLSVVLGKKGVCPRNHAMEQRQPRGPALPPPFHSPSLAWESMFRVNSSQKSSRGVRAFYEIPDFEFCVRGEREPRRAMRLYVQYLFCLKNKVGGKVTAPNRTHG